MKHLSPNDFAASPQRGPGRRTEQEMMRQLRQTFRPADRARSEAQRLEANPWTQARAFLDEVEQSRAEHHAVLRNEALACLVANIDAIGVLTVEPTADQAEHRLEDAQIELERVHTERRSAAARARALWAKGRTAYTAWADASGAVERTSPWGSAGQAVLAVGAFSLGEAFVGAEVLAGPPIVGVPPPIVLGLFLSIASLSVGALGSLGHMLAADARRLLRFAGWATLGLTALAWLFVCLCGAHMRASIEAGGSGTIAEIAASLRAGMLTPMLSPMSLLLTAASSLTAIATWVKLVGYFGAPFGHRAKDNARRWCLQQLDDAEAGHKAAIRTAVAQAVEDLEVTAEAAARPALGAEALEREIQVMLAGVRESERAIDRGHKSLWTTYAATFGRIRPAVDVSGDLQPSEIAVELLHDPASLHLQVEALRRAAAVVRAACDRGMLKLHQAEVAHLARVDALYSQTSDPRVAGETAPALLAAGG